MKIMIIFGTRPEGIKFAPLIRLMKLEQDFQCITVNTAQHREMLDQILDMFSIVPDYDLNLMKSGQSLTVLTAEMISKLDSILIKERPDLVLVLGDTATTFAGAYSAFLNSIPIAHVEAGLRTYNPVSPFPEEMYRQLVTRLSRYHFAPTEHNRENLLREGVHDEQIVVVGNTVIDALLDISGRSYTFSESLQPILGSGRRIILVTTHRRENFSYLKNIYLVLNQLLQEYEDIEVVFPVHFNPKVRSETALYLKKHPRLHTLEPLDYPCFVNLMQASYLIITDSGGIQEEAATLGIPVLVTRESTERPEGVAAGTLKVTGTSTEYIHTAVRLLLDDREAHSAMSQAQNPYGNGTASLQIISFLKNTFAHTTTRVIDIPEGPLGNV